MGTLLDAANRYAVALACLVSLAAALPAATFLIDSWRGTLGANPLETLTRESGRWTFLLLITTLALTPLRHAASLAARSARARFGRRPADWNWIVRLRRTVGLACFGYACGHAAIYFWLDAGLEVSAVLTDLEHKPYIAAGMCAFLLLLPLAATSTDGWMRRLKRTWKRLHRLVYLIGALAALHFLWLSKPGMPAAYFYAAAVALLLGYRVVLWAATGIRSADALGEFAPDRRPQTDANPKENHP